MSWVCSISREATKEIQSFPKPPQKQIYTSLQEMETNPFQGDVCVIRSGKFQHCHRKRVGKYRVIFQLDTLKKIVLVLTILRRGDTTYN